MGGGPKYSRFATMDRTKVRDYIERVVVNSTKTIERKDTKCQKCGFTAHYTFIRCPECNHLQEVEK